MALNRRGAEFRSATPTVVLLIGLVLILYILFLPPADREVLLSGTGGGGGVGPGGAPVGGGVILMDKYVGTLIAQAAEAQEYALPATSVFTRTNTEELKFIDSMVIKRSAFSNQPAAISFRGDPSVARNYLVTFNVERAKGPLRVEFNGQTLYERDIRTRSPEPIRIPQELIRSENNITFSTSASGWMFWDANEYVLRNVLISADITDYAGSSAEQHFTITPQEHERVDKTILEFVPQCDAKTAGRLSVTVNGQLLYSGFLDCGVLTRQDVPKSILTIGDNRVGFSSNAGSYTIDRIRIKSALRQQEYPVFYFNLPPDMFAQASTFDGRVVVTLRFSEANTLKRGAVIVNGFTDVFSTQDIYWQATLDPNVLIPNANAIQIVPQSTSLNIAELRVELLG